MPNPGQFERPLAEAVRVAVGRSRRDLSRLSAGARTGTEWGAGTVPGSTIRFGRLGMTDLAGDGFYLKGAKR
jgi:hypothetical protein